MPYYFFDRCPTEKVDEIGDLCRSIGLKEYKCDPPVRHWGGEHDKIEVVQYRPNLSVGPLAIQTDPRYDYKDPTIQGIFKKVVKITGSKHVHTGMSLQSMVEIDMSTIQ